MALFTEILGAPKWHKSGAGVQKSLNFSQVQLLSAQISFFYQVFIFLLQTTANNSRGGRVYVKKIASKIVIIYIAVALPAPRCTSGAHRKWSWVHLCHTLQSGGRITPLPPCQNISSAPLPYSAVWSVWNIEPNWWSIPTNFTLRTSWFYFNLSHGTQIYLHLLIDWWPWLIHTLSTDSTRWELQV